MKNVCFETGNIYFFVFRDISMVAKKPKTKQNKLQKQKQKRNEIETRKQQLFYTVQCFI